MARASSSPLCSPRRSEGELRLTQSEVASIEYVRHDIRAVAHLKSSNDGVPSLISYRAGSSIASVLTYVNWPSFQIARTRKGFSYFGVP